VNRILLFFSLCSVAGAGCAQTAELLPNALPSGAIPGWVKLDRGALAEDRVAQAREQVQLAMLTAELNAKPPAEARDRYPGNSNRLGPIEAYRYDGPTNPQAPKVTDAPPPGLARPSVKAGAWKVSMPNIRAHAARLVLQRSF
jgi:hypothetical protein